MIKARIQTESRMHSRHEDVIPSLLATLASFWESTIPKPMSLFSRTWAVSWLLTQINVSQYQSLCLCTNSTASLAVICLISEPAPTAAAVFVNTSFHDRGMCPDSPPWSFLVSGKLWVRTALLYSVRFSKKKNWFKNTTETEETEIWLHSSNLTENGEWYKCKVWNVHLCLSYM